MSNPIGIRIQERDGRSVFIELSGELDIGCLKALKEALRNAVDSRRAIFVDLSEVTFLDALCAQELAIQSQLHPGRMALCAPSSQVELSVAACDLEDWFDFHPMEEKKLAWSASRTRFRTRG